MNVRVAALAALVPLLGCHHAGAPVPSAPASASAAPAPAAAPLLAARDVDRLLRAEWTKAGVAPTPPADDATWLRRAWIDVLGTIPPAEVVTRFLADAAPDRRTRALEDLLSSPLWADHWTEYWDDVWMGRDTRAQDVDRGAFRAWLHDALARDEPWNVLVTSLLTATGVNSTGGAARERFADDGRDGAASGVNGAVNWTLRFANTPQDMAGTASRTLLGVQIQCAQCHDHKTEKWKQADFQAFAAAFTRTRFVPIDRGKAMGQVKRVEVRDLGRAAPRLAKMGDLEAIEKAAPRALDGTDLGAGTGVRVALARWMTSKDNPWFARAFVNRMWGHFLGRGFSNPVDDMRPSNAPVAPALLDALAADFVASGWDVKHLVRIVVGSEAYGLSAAPLAEATAKADPEATLWERFRVTPVGPDELLASLVSATRLDAVVRANGKLDLDAIRFRVRQRYGFLFDVDEESDDHDYEGTIAQALALLDGSVVSTGVRPLPGSALAEIVAGPGDDGAKIDALYLRTLSRFPTPDERARWVRFVLDATAAPPAPPPTPASRGGKPDALTRLEARKPAPREDAHARAFEDVLWALLNCSEFALNH